MSAPSDKGKILSGVIVLSTIKATPAAFAIDAIALMSGRRIFGLPTLSKKITFVLSVIVFSIFSSSSTSKKEVFIPKFNKQFSHPPREKETAYAKLVIPNLDIILCKKSSRKVTAGNTFSYNAKKYLIRSNKNYRFRTININVHQDGTTSYDIMGKKIEVDLYKNEVNTLQEAS